MIGFLRDTLGLRVEFAEPARPNCRCQGNRKRSSPDKHECSLTKATVQMCSNIYMRSHWQWLVGGGAGIMTVIVVFVAVGHSVGWW
jgi:hypothetical protein